MTSTLRPESNPNRNSKPISIHAHHNKNPNFGLPFPRVTMHNVCVCDDLKPSRVMWVLVFQVAISPIAYPC